MKKKFITSFIFFYCFTIHFATSMPPKRMPHPPDRPFRNMCTRNSIQSLIDCVETQKAVVALAKKTRKEEGIPKIAIFVDIDETLITPEKMISSDPSFVYSLEKFRRQSKSEEGFSGDPLNEAVSLSATLKQQIIYKAVESFDPELSSESDDYVEAETPENTMTARVIYALQNMEGISVTSLTSREPDQDTINTTLRHLLDAGINLNLATHFLEPFRVGDCGYFTNGCFFLNRQQEKGPALACFLTYLEEQLDYVIFIDDSQKHVESVISAMSTLVPCTGIVYTRSKTKKQFDKKTIKEEGQPMLHSLIDRISESITRGLEESHDLRELVSTLSQLSHLLRDTPYTPSTSPETEREEKEEEEKEEQILPPPNKTQKRKPTKTFSLPDMRSYEEDDKEP